MKKNITYALCVMMVILMVCGCARGREPELLPDGSAAGFSLTDPESETAKGSGARKKTEACIYVYICGAVKEPGVFQLPEESRVYEAVEKAGGFTKKAKQDAVNLAEILTDGQMVVIPEVTDLSSSSEATSTSGISPEGKVNINKATLEELMTLTGIGESKAKLIIDYRTANGSFQSPDDLMKIDGIKEATYNKIKDRIIV